MRSKHRSKWIFRPLELASPLRSGSGNHVFADKSDSAGAATAGEVDGLLNKVVQAVSLTVKFEPSVEILRLYNDLQAQQIGDGAVMIELGDLCTTPSSTSPPTSRAR